MSIPERARDIAERVESFVREVVVPYESDPRRDHHGAQLDELVMEMREKARTAGIGVYPFLATFQGSTSPCPTQSNSSQPCHAELQTCPA